MTMVHQCHAANKMSQILSFDVLQHFQYSVPLYQTLLSNSVFWPHPLPTFFSVLNLCGALPVPDLSVDIDFFYYPYFSLRHFGLLGV